MSNLSLKSRTDSIDANNLVPSVVFLKRIVKKTPKADNSRYFRKEQISGTEEYLIAKSLRFAKRNSNTVKFSSFPKFLPPIQSKTRSFPKTNHGLYISSIPLPKPRKRDEGVVRRGITPEPSQLRSKFMKGRPLQEIYQEFEPVFCIVNENVMGNEEEEEEDKDKEEEIGGKVHEARLARFRVQKVEHKHEGQFKFVQENEY